jgi:hypothetical protein
MFGLRRVQRRRVRLLALAYCLGLIPILALVLYVEDGELIGRTRCLFNRAAGFQKLTGAFASKRALTNSASCCSAGEESKMEPKLLSASMDGRCTPPEAGRGCALVCVTGVNLGGRRGVGRLMVGATPAAGYQTWLDPGTPYGVGHYAEVCGVLESQPPAKSVAVQLTTAQGSSNTLLLQPPETLIAAAQRDTREGAVRQAR